MITIFRKIRQGLVKNDKFSKYTIYAIGEIFLVVVGILIALQINNLNETRKAKQKEFLFLSEFKSSIANDFRIFEEQYTPRLNRKKSGLDSMFYYMKYKKSIEDTLFVNFYSKMRQGLRLTHFRGTYEALESSGLDYIRNDSLRSALNKAYTVLPFFQFFSHQFDAEHNPKVSELQDKIFALTTYDGQGFGDFYEFDVKVENVLRNQDFMWIYNIELQRYNEYIRRLDQMKKALREIENQIEEELKKF